MFAATVRYGSRFLRTLSATNVTSSASRQLSCSSHVACKTEKFNEPLSGHLMARPGGISTFMRLPYQETSEGLDACFVGIPIDHGCSNKSGTRLGPRYIRVESALIRACSSIGAAPFESMQVADIGDVRVNLYDLKKCCNMISDQYSEIISNGCKPLTLGGDHTITYPILQAIAKRYGPVGLVHVDAHSDVSDIMLGEKIAHGTPFRRAFDEQLIDPAKVIQIGLRGSQYLKEKGGQKWQIDQGFRVVPVEDCWYKSMTPLMQEVREMMGDMPVYLTFDIDALDPAFAPGTGTPEIGGLTSIQGMEIIRGCRGLNIVGADLVEVSPPYDTTGTTALTGANLLFEMLCMLPGVKYSK